MVTSDKCAEQREDDIFKNTPRNIVNVRVIADPAKRGIIIESKTHLKEIFIADITGKILIRIQPVEKQTKWNVNLKSYPNATFLVKYISEDDQWGAEKFVSCIESLFACDDLYTNFKSNIVPEMIWKKL